MGIFILRILQESIMNGSIKKSRRLFWNPSIRKFNIVAFVVLAVFLIACDSTEQTQVTRMVTVEVTRIIERSESYKVTRIVEVPVTRIIEVPITPIVELDGAEIVSSSEIQTSNIFSQDSLNTTIPEGVLDEVTFFPGGGGGPQCTNSQTTIEALWDPAVVLGHQIWIHACGLDPEDARITISTPQEEFELALEWNDTSMYFVGDHVAGVSTTSELNDALVYQVDMYFYASPMGPTGIYRFIAAGPNGATEETSVEYIEAGGAHSIWYEDEDFVLLYGFVPNERVRLVAYEPSESRYNAATFVGWSGYVVDSDGKLTINLEDESSTNAFSAFVAIGDVSGTASVYQVRGEVRELFLAGPTEFWILPQ